jgi:hypothetical protein
MVPPSQLLAMPLLKGPPAEIFGCPSSQNPYPTQPLRLVAWEQAEPLQPGSRSFEEEVISHMNDADMIYKDESGQTLM